MARNTAKINRAPLAETVPEYLRSRPQWLVWRLETVNGRLTKPPYSALTLRKTDINDPTNWTDFKTAKEIAARHGFDGVGFALAPDDDLTGLDLDGCRDANTGEIASWAQDILGFQETYAEISPSGEGIRLFSRGKVEAATQCNPAGVEIYGGGRYLTVTGHRVAGAPDEIKAAPFTLHALHRRVESFRSNGKDASAVAIAKVPASGGGDSFFRRVNDLAMKNLATWVPLAFPTANFQAGTGAYRVSSADLCRDLEEDLSISPEGIVDFGLHDMGDPREGKRTPIDVIKDYTSELIEGKAEGEVTVADAALWLCETLGVDPVKLGWREREEIDLAAVFAASPIDWDYVARLVSEQEEKFPAPVALLGGLPDIPGGTYSEEELLPAISARFALVDRSGEVNVVHFAATGEDHTMAAGSFEAYLANVIVHVVVVDAKGEKKDAYLPAARWWLSNPKRPPIRRAIFEPHRKARSDEYNFWRGFGVAPIQGRDKIKAFLAHLWLVVARRDRAKYRYIIRWLAWAVQHPEKRAETVIVLKSEAEGSGKTTVSDAMRVIFGKHAATISDPEEIVGRHVDDLEFAVFGQLEEALFAGDPKTADRMQHAITGAMLRINPKGRKAYQAPNRLHAILTTNHDWAIKAGKDARRWFVCEVSEEKVGDRAWFDKIYADLQAGGYGQLLDYLQRRKLGNWHPRQMPRTIELAEQQIRSASSIHQWLLTSAEQGCIDGYGGKTRKDHLQLRLGESHGTAPLFDAYAGAQRAQGGRIATRDAFSKALAKILGETARVRDVVKDGVRHHRGFYIPRGEELARLVERSIGVAARDRERAMGDAALQPPEDDRKGRFEQ